MSRGRKTAAILSRPKPAAHHARHDQAAGDCVWGLAVLSCTNVRARGGMVDALASGASERKLVGVQLPPRARYFFSDFLLSGFS